MSRKLVITGALSAVSLFVSSLVGVMIYLYANAPKAEPFATHFSLVDDRRLPVDESVFHGHPALVYFGYTHCPEACPTTLFEVADWLHTLGSQGADLKAYFFSIDPERDTPEVMHDYVTAFSDRIRGITGSPEEMRKVTDDWLVHATKVPASDGNYHMNHTVDLLLIGADGRLKSLIPYGASKDMALSMIKESLLRIPGGKS